MAVLPGIGGIFGGAGDQRLIDALSGVGLSANLGLCLDLADAFCYAGGQQANDLSGAGFHFANGTSTADTTSDMTFVGSPGSLDKYTYFQNDSGATGQANSVGMRGAVANPSWVVGAHKDNANFTVAGWFYTSSARNGGGGRTLFATSEIFWTTGAGFAVALFGSLIFFTNGQARMSGLAEPSDNAWHFILCSVNETLGTGVLQIDGDQVVPPMGTYSLTSTAAPSGNLNIGMNTARHWPLGFGGRVGAAFGWSTALSATQGLAAYHATKDRYL